MCININIGYWQDAQRLPGSGWSLYTHKLISNYNKICIYQKSSHTYIAAAHLDTRTHEYATVVRRHLYAWHFVTFNPFYSPRYEAKYQVAAT